MSDLGLRSFFFAGDPADPRANATLRQRLAMAVMAKQRKAPQNLGEGLSAIGDALGDLGTQRMLIEADKAQQAAAMEVPPAAGSAPAVLPPGARSSVSGVDTPPAPQTSAMPMEYAPDQYNPIDQLATLREQRAPYMAQLEADPSKKLTAAALMTSEEGTGAQNAPARQALAETIFNRGVARGYPNVGKVMDPRYYEPMQNGNFANHVAMLNANPAIKAQVYSELRNAAGSNPEMQPTNVSNLATDNASGSVAANSRGNQTLAYVAPNQENFFRKDVRPDVHGADAVARTRDWYNRTAVAPPAAGQAAPLPATAAAPPPISPTAAAQDETLGLISGRQGFFPPTASLGRAGAASDAPQPGMSPAMGQSVIDTVQSGRDGIAKAMQPPPPAAPAPPPASAPVISDIKPAPAPGVQTAQAAVPGYVMPKVQLPQEPQRIQPSARELQLEDFVKRGSVANPYIANGPAAQELQQLKADREYRQQKQDAVYKEQLDAARAKELEREKQLESQAGRITGVQKDAEAVREAKQKNDLRAQFGNMPPDEVFKNLTESQKLAQAAAKSLTASKAAMDIFKEGTFSGAGADTKLFASKVLTAFGLVDKGDKIANTETFRAALQPVVSSLLRQTSGTSQLSDFELRFAQRAAAGDITLDPKTVPMLMNIIDKASRGIMGDHQRKMDVLFGDNPQAKAVYGVENPEKAADPMEGRTATGPNGQKVIRRNGKWEPM